MSDYAERVTGLVSQLADARAEVADLRLRINAVDAEHEQLAKDRAELSARFYAAIRRAKAEVWREAAQMLDDDCYGESYYDLKGSQMREWVLTHNKNQRKIEADMNARAAQIEEGG